MIRGPLEYVPPVEVEVVTKRKAIPLDENEGIYVRHIKSGKVRGYHCFISVCTWCTCMSRFVQCVVPPTC